MKFAVVVAVAVVAPSHSPVNKSNVLMMFLPCVPTFDNKGNNTTTQETNKQTMATTTAPDCLTELKYPYKTHYKLLQSVVYGIHGARVQFLYPPLSISLSLSLSLCLCESFVLVHFYWISEAAAAEM